jgi:hypothetical protein
VIRRSTEPITNAGHCGMSIFCHVSPFPHALHSSSFPLSSSVSSLVAIPTTVSGQSLPNRTDGASDLQTASRFILRRHRAGAFRSHYSKLRILTSEASPGTSGMTCQARIHNSNIALFLQCSTGLNCACKFATFSLPCYLVDIAAEECVF